MLKKICPILLLLIFLIFAKDVRAALNISTDIKEIDINTELIVKVDYQINKPDGTGYYLRGAFFKPETSSFCGYTFNGVDWYKGPYGNQGHKNLFRIEIENNTWIGDLKVKIDNSVNACKESGQYYFKVIRYTEGGSTTNSNEISLTIVIPTPTPTPTNTPTPTKTPTTVNTVAPTSNVGLVAYGSSPILEPSGLKSNTGKTYKRFSTSTPGSVLGKGSDSINGLKDNSDEMTEESKNSSWKVFVTGGVGFIISACGILLYRKYKDRKEEEFQL